ncbi:PAS/PAC sensor signal transduction histidine kinase [Haloferax elongans ATCC BAA-1513]|uniref:PAS/PAC sensor signal transduction histidine kinase n=1 Tax=Haloferax elongans ATCC BAA-1513 TaxID=1230453 RepID=M0HPB6_HALEO|nr:histidine kinase N-terminal 7TM domain-containing protein [Haloferax elongans]ELZ85588.1 PAS/PAC sensor signal transduction histidine kinase [Haloferax elongans ATCC BAA-1513]
MAGVPPAPIVLLVGVSLAALCVARAFVNRRRDRPGATELGALLAVVATWCGLYAAQLAATTTATMVFLYQLIYLCIVAVPPLWFLFASSYTGRQSLPLLGWLVAGIISVAYFLGALLWPETTLVWTDVAVVSLGSLRTLSLEKGPVFYVFIGYTYVLLLWGAVRIGRHAITSHGALWNQTRVIGVALFIVLVPNAAFNLGFAPFKFDPTPFVFTLSVLLFVIADLRYGLFRAHPLARDVAREHVIEEMVDGVLVVDRANIITDVNPAAATALDVSPQSVIGEELDAVLPAFATRIESSDSEIETYYHASGDVTYDVRVSPFSRPRNGLQGRIVTLHDISEARQREERLSVLNRILRHDIRNGLNVVGGFADLVADTDTNAEMRQHAASRIKHRTDELLDIAEKIRAIEKGLDRQNERQSAELMGVLRTVTDRIDQDWPATTVTLSGPDEVTVLTTPIVESLFHNLVENAAEHGGQSPTIDVEVTASDEWVTVEVADDGPGIPKKELDAIESGETQLAHASGIGLWLVTWLVRQSSGTIEFDATDEGTVVTVRLKRARPDDETVA